MNNIDQPTRRSLSESESAALPGKRLGGGHSTSSCYRETYKFLSIYDIIPMIGPTHPHCHTGDCHSRDGGSTLRGTTSTSTCQWVPLYLASSSPLMSQRKKFHVKMIPRIFRSTSKSTDSEQDQWDIRCIIQNDHVTFTVKSSRHHRINDLKILVLGQACHGVLRNVDSKDLAVYRVSTIFRPGSNNHISTYILCLIRSMSTSMIKPGNLSHL